MRKPSLHSMLDTPVGVVIVLAAAIFGVELLLMTLIRVFLRPAFGLSGEMWSLIDAVSLTIIITPLLYWLVFRKIRFVSKMCG